MKRKSNRKPTNTTNRQSTEFSFRGFINQERTRIIWGLLWGLFTCYIFISMVGFLFTGGIDQSLVDAPMRKVINNPDYVAVNPTGPIGAWFSNLLINRCFGLPSFFLCYLSLLCSVRIIGFRIRHFKRKLFIGMMIVLWGSLLLGFISESISNLLDCDTGYLFPGGCHGYFVSIWLNSLIGHVGTILLLIFTFAVILFFGFERTFYRCVNYIKECVRKQRERTLASLKAKRAAEQAHKQAAKDEQAGQYEMDDPYEEEKPEIQEQPEENEETFQSQTEFEITPSTDDDNEEEPEDEEEERIVDNDEDLTLDVNTETREETVEQNIPLEDYDPTLDLSHYEYPTLDLLEEHSSGNPKVTNEELEANKNKIVETLRNYKIEITKIKATIGPTVTLYEIIPAPGVKISKIKNLEDDIALSLAALGIRIIAPIPGAGTIGIEVPNRNPEVVSMRGLIASKKFQESKFALPVALGRTISNETYTFDLTKMPHLLVAGATGQGKSVGLNAIITSLLYKKHPSQLKFVMVDPKKVELSIYSIIEKHFLAKLPDAEEAIITDTTKVVNTLNSLCIEMDTRYDLLKEAQVRNIKEYNEKFIKRQLNPEKGHRYLPYIVVVVDEFADLIMTAGKEVETPIARIAQLARAVGIHMIIATQRPSTNVITGIIKANFPARIAFKVASMIDSRTILDAPGANQLIGRGDMLISVNSEMVRVQCAFVDTPEVDAITHFIARQQSYPSAFALPEYIPDNEGGGISEADLGQRDPLFDEAARLVVSSQQGSTSSIQRRFSIGYNRAGRIMDQLEAAGIVGPFEGSKARQVLVSDEATLNRML